MPERSKFLLLYEVVPLVRLERTRLAARDFESRVSTNSTTGAEKARMIGSPRAGSSVEC